MIKSKSLFLVAGARPNFMKIAPIIREINRQDYFRYKLVHTGQHYDHGMSDVFFQDLGIPEPDFHLSIGSASHAEQTARIMMAFEPLIIEHKPTCVIVVGDVNSTLACSIVAKKLAVKVAHVEAGLRSGDMEMPEEINRVVTDSISDYYFVTEEDGLKNLAAEGKPPRAIFHVGHVMIDNLLYELEVLNSVDKDRLITSGIKSSLQSYGVVTLHRPSNVDDRDVLARILGALTTISSELPLVFPIHPRTKAKIQEFGIDLPKTITMVEPLGYREFLNLWKDAKIVVTDSGGLQEETTALGVPCVTLRENTERPITLTQGSNVLAGSNHERIISAVREKLASVFTSTARPELWDGQAAARILEILRSEL